jgi:hypothetical protein
VFGSHRIGLIKSSFPFPLQIALGRYILYLSIASLLISILSLLIYHTFLFAYILTLFLNSFDLKSVKFVANQNGFLELTIVLNDSSQSFKTLSKIEIASLYLMNVS